MMYTLQSIKTGKYISSLFSDRHDDTFAAKYIECAYIWSSLEHVEIEQFRLGNCKVVKLEEKTA